MAHFSTVTYQQHNLAQGCG